MTVEEIFEEYPDFSEEEKNKIIAMRDNAKEHIMGVKSIEAFNPHPDAHVMPDFSQPVEHMNLDKPVSPPLGFKEGVKQTEESYIQKDERWQKESMDKDFEGAKKEVEENVDKRLKQFSSTADDYTPPDFLT